MQSPAANDGAPLDRDRLLALSDDELLRLCRTDRFRGSGRGGQKRNATDSAVRVALPALKISATSDDTRSQRTNRRLALRRLRREIAFQCRQQTPHDWHGPWAPKQNAAIRAKFAMGSNSFIFRTWERAETTKAPAMRPVMNG